MLLGLGILGLGRRGRGIERDDSSSFFFFSFLLILVYILLHIGILTMVVLTMDGWEFFCNTSNTVEC